MKRSTFFKSLLALLTFPVLTSFVKKEDNMERATFIKTLLASTLAMFGFDSKKEFDFDGYLMRNPNVSVSKVPVGSKMAIEYTSINVPEFRPEDVLSLWRKTGKLLHLDILYYNGETLVTKQWIIDQIKLQSKVFRQSSKQYNEKLDDVLILANELESKNIYVANNIYDYLLGIGFEDERVVSYDLPDDHVYLPEVHHRGGVFHLYTLSEISDPRYRVDNINGKPSLIEKFHWRESKSEVIKPLKVIV